MDKETLKASFKSFFEELKENNTERIETLYPYAIKHIGDLDPTLRDEYIYRFFWTVIRYDLLADETLVELLDTMHHNIHPGKPVLTRSFSYLVLAALLKRQSVKAFVDQTKIDAVFETALNAFREETDMRGYDDTLGFVHAIAHGADVLEALATLDITPAQTSQILDAIKTKVYTTDGAYHHNEDKRMVNVLVRLHHENHIDKKTLSAWIDEFQPTKQALPKVLIEGTNVRLFLSSLLIKTERKALHKTIISVLKRF